MSGFKLIAIIPLKDCSTKFRKNLKVGFPYKFYRAYDIQLNNESSEITSIRFDENNSAPDELYSLKNGIDLSFSAVVGKNGTGKSTIIELLYYFIYVLGKKKQIIDSVLTDLENEHRLLSEDYHHLKQSIDIQIKIEGKEKLTKFEKDFLANNFKDLDVLIFELNQKYRFANSKKELKNRNDIYLFFRNELFNKVCSLYILIKNEREKIEPAFEKELNVSVIYEFDKIVYEITLFKNHLSITKHNNFITPEKINFEDFDLSLFFYTISLNYSHHGLNSKIIGKWITKLFHKNDAYTTPVVINPMRNEGNFDINHEIRLSRERLMANLIFDLINKKENLLLGKYKISKFIFTPKTLSPPFPLGFDKEFINSLNSSFIFKTKLKIDSIDDNIDYWDIAISYLEKKISKIDTNYHNVIHLHKNLFDSRSELENFILKDNSHITKKVRQVINFLKVTYTKENRAFWELPKNTVRIELSPKKMLEWLSLCNINFKTIKPSEVIEYALPGFFNIDFELENDKGEKFKFGKLSSGEQQMIFNINSILYHLYNIQSVHTPYAITENVSNQNDEIKRVKYNNVNIILDEVELYYHPEMQRVLVKNLVDSFENIKVQEENGITSINVCFLTHSPFILSDIPRQNTLLLNNKVTNLVTEFNNDKTFGSNIHDSLIDNFYMESTIGEYSKQKINEFTKAVNNVMLNKKKPRLLKKSKTELENLGGEKFIELIGDSLVRDKLLQLYFLATEKNDKQALKKYYEKKLNDLKN